MMVGILVGTIAGSWVLTRANPDLTTAGLGAALALYALSGLITRPWKMPSPAERWLSPLIGLATGLITGSTGVFVIAAVPYLQALDLDKEDLVQALGLSSTISTIALAIGLTRGNALNANDLTACRAWTGAGWHVGGTDCKKTHQSRHLPVVVSHLSVPARLELMARPLL